MLNLAGVMCLRCRKMFATTDELRAHMLLPADQICKPVISVPPRDPEDGITPEIDRLLLERKDGLKITTWRQIWHLLFPHDVDVPFPGESFALSS